MYKWVDQNGKVTYSNVTPPSSAQKVETFKETTEAPMDRAIRIENERIQSEDAAALKEYQNEQKRISREEQKQLLREKEKRISIENAQKKQRHKEIVSAENNKMKSAYELELTRLQMKQKIAEKRCREIGTKRCLPATRKRYERKINALNNDPQQYFYNQSQRSSRSTTPSSPQQSTISGGWDTEGRHYTPIGGGNAIRDDNGEVMIGVGGGFIDTETGEFVPAN